MGYPTKIQLIKREKSEQWYINFPSAVAQAMEFQKGETVEWLIENKRKMRISAINQLKNKYRESFAPNYNKIACKYFDDLMLENKNTFFIQHAENGGEYHIKELGYWVDGYDKENNIVYEYDERKHFDVNGNLSERDIIRQKEIENFLKCKFIRIKKNIT